MNSKTLFYRFFGWSFFALVASLGIMNLIMVHAVPGMIYLLLSLIFLPPVNTFLSFRLGIRIPAAIKVILGIVIVWFTLGISDLAEIYGL